jgi:hypothetical protein
MRPLTVLLGIMLVLQANASVAAEASEQSATSYVPRLSDLMVVIQTRHSKLFYAVRRENWPLAYYELEQLNSTLAEIERFYPASDLTGTKKLMNLISESINAKDETKFDQSFDQVTAECNRCHEAADRAFIFIRRPVLPSLFSNQMYGPRPSERRKQGH